MMPNMLGVALSAVQIVLLVKYPSYRDREKLDDHDSEMGDL